MVQVAAFALNAAHELAVAAAAVLAQSLAPELAAAVEAAEHMHTADAALACSLSAAVEAVGEMHCSWVASAQLLSVVWQAPQQAVASCLWQQCRVTCLSIVIVLMQDLEQTYTLRCNDWEHL